ncbi:M56 family metallopeptidase [Oryzobacter terrae]|uniref:M56 family metallopeptidase n=1 Tax=Oryzobacter terrae TaxID=1620385 RepID=UPI00366EF6C3
MIPIVLAGLAVLLAWVAPGLLARRHRFRRTPRAALVAWQAVTVGGILAALAAAPAAVPLLVGGDTPLEHPWLVAAAGVLSGAVLVRLLVTGHDVGMRLRRVRARHREIVDVVGAPDEATGDVRVRVLQHPTPTAYCIPGRQSRVVLSQGVLDALPHDQLSAVVAHEHAHLRGRHDLLLEFFSVAHEAVPRPLHSDAALAEVSLLVEALADRAAVRRSGEVATARALVALAEGRTPDAALGAGTTAPVRLRLLADGPAPPALTAVAYLVAVLAATLPLILLGVAWT